MHDYKFTGHNMQTHTHLKKSFELSPATDEGARVSGRCEIVLDELRHPEQGK